MDKSLKREKLLLSISENEMDMFIEGSSIYRLGYNVYSPGNSMINLDAPMGEIYSYYREDNTLKVEKELEDTLMRLMKYKSGHGVYEAFSIMSYQLKMEQKGISPFRINSQLLIDELKKYAIMYEEKLKKIKEYEGTGLQEGLWEAMKIENSMNINKFGIKIF